MDYRKLSVFVLLILSCTGMIMAQTGTISGTITDGNSKEPIPFANIVGPDNAGTSSDFDGNYSLDLPAGQQQIKVSVVGYPDTSYTVNVVAGQTKTFNIAITQTATILHITTVVGGKYKKNLSEEIVTVEVLNKGIIDNSAAYNMDEAMEKVPGVTIVDGQANIRGGSGWSYGAGSRVMVLVDDIPMLTADAADVKWSFIPTENVQQVEVVKGAASALYGSSALNGVINILTAWPKNEPYTKLTLYGGFYQNPSNPDYVWWGRNQPVFGGGNFVHRHRFNTFDLVASGNWKGDKSYLEGGSNQEVRASIKTRWRPKNVKGLSMGINTAAYNSTGSTFFLWNDDKDSIYRPLPNSTSQYSTLRLAVDPYLTYFDKHENRYKFTGRYFNAMNTNNTGQGSLPQLFYGEFQYQRRWTPINLNLVAGVSGYYASVKPPGGNAVDQSLVGQHDGNNVSIYAQVEKKFFDRLSLGAGVRYEYFRIDTFKSDAIPVFRFGFNYQATEATFIRGSIGQGYRFPTIAEKFVNTNVGGIGIYPNPQLQPEKGWSAEIGIKQGIKLGEWLGYLDVSGFINMYQNMMEFTFGQYDTVVTIENLLGLGFASQNIGNTRILGTEFTAIGQGKIAGKFPLTLLAGYTYIDPKSLNWDDTLTLYNLRGQAITPTAGASRDGMITYAGTSSSTKNILKYRNKHTLKLDAQLDIKKWLFGVSVQYTSFQENIDYLFVSDFIIGFESTLGTHAFSGLRDYRENNHRGNTQFDARIGITPIEGVQFLFIVKNILNQDIMQRPAYMSPPRNFTVQMTAEF